jgi:hypothetical protein
MPQPFRLNRNVQLHVDPHAILERPDLARQLAIIVTESAAAEVDVGDLFARLTESHAEAAMAVFLALKSGRARNEALAAVARLRYSQDNFLEFKKLLGALANAQAERDTVVHALWAVLPNLPEHAILIDPAQALRDRAIFGTLAATGDWDRWVEHKMRSADHEVWQERFRRDHPPIARGASKSLDVCCPAPFSAS